MRISDWSSDVCSSDLVRAEIGTHSRQRDGQRRPVDESHRGREHAGGEHHALAPRRGFLAELSRARFCFDNAATARLYKRLWHSSTSPLICRCSSVLCRRFEVADQRSEEHTSELQVTNAHLVCRLLLEKKKM